MKTLSAAATSLTICSCLATAYLLMHPPTPAAKESSGLKALAKYDFSTPASALHSEREIVAKQDFQATVEFERIKHRQEMEEFAKTTRFGEQFEDSGVIVLLYTTEERGKKEYKYAQMEKDARSGYWHPTFRFLSETSAGQRIQEWEDTPKPKVDLFVAKSDLPAGTQITLSNLNSLLALKRVTEESVEPDDTVIADGMLGARLNRSLKAGERLGKKVLFRVPDGKKVLKVQVDSSSATWGFLQLGQTVDILISVRLDGQFITLPLLVNALLVEIDSGAVSLALDTKQTRLLKLAQSKRAQFVPLLRPSGRAGEYDAKYDIELLTRILDEK